MELDNLQYRIDKLKLKIERLEFKHDDADGDIDVIDILEMAEIEGMKAEIEYLKDKIKEHE